MIELLHISALSIERTADWCGYERGGGYEKDEIAERTLVDGPTMVDVYYDLCKSRVPTRIPTQKEFLEGYQKANVAWFSEQSGAMQDGMLHRVARAWPSFVCEHHLFSLCVESGLCRSAYKNAKDDIESGADMRLAFGLFADEIHVASFTATRDGWAKAFRKQRKRPNGQRLYAPLNFEGQPPPQEVGLRPVGNAKAGKFRLYTLTHVDDIAHAVKAMVERSWNEATVFQGKICEGLVNA
jgi:hypothetical protein